MCLRSNAFVPRGAMCRAGAALGRTDIQCTRLQSSFECRRMSRRVLRPYHETDCWDYCTEVLAWLFLPKDYGKYDDVEPEEVTLSPPTNQAKSASQPKPKSVAQPKPNKVKASDANESASEKLDNDDDCEVTGRTDQYYIIIVTMMVSSFCYCSSPFYR